MIPAQSILKSMSGAAALFAVSALMASSPRASAQGPNPTTPTLVRSSGPILAARGETILLCAANNQGASIAPAPTSAVTPPAPQAGRW